MADAPGGHFLHNLLLFGRMLRRLGLDVHVGRMLDAVTVIDDIGISRRRDFREALRTLLVHRKDDLALFDEAFDVFWRQPKHSKTSLDLRSMGEQRRFRQPQVGPPPPGKSTNDRGEENDDSDEDIDQVELTRTFSAREVLREKSFANYTAEEMDQARAMLDELRWDIGLRRTRRWGKGNGRNLDLRRAMRKNLRFGGEVVELPRRRRKATPRRLVLICDVSGSMERYTRILLQFVHSLYGGLDNRVEAFLFATRLTRVTGHLGYQDIDRAIGEVSKSVPDWAGGTRIGDVLKVFNYRWARRVLGWGSIVLIVSDGWDRGEPDAFGAEMARLQRSSHRLIWLNPLAGAEGYEPLTRGMQAALPYIDDLLPVHNLASLEDLALHLNTLPDNRPVRLQQGVSVEKEEEETIEGQGRKPRKHQFANPTFRHPLWGRDGRR